MLPLAAGLGISCGAQLLVLIHVTKSDATLPELVSELSQRLVQRVVHPHDHIGSPTSVLVLGQPHRPTPREWRSRRIDPGKGSTTATATLFGQAMITNRSRC